MGGIALGKNVTGYLTDKELYQWALRGVVNEVNRLKFSVSDMERSLKEDYAPWDSEYLALEADIIICKSRVNDLKSNATYLQEVLDSLG